MKHEKIFDEDVEQYLMELGFPEEKIANIQFQRALSRTINLLNDIVRLLEDEQFDNIEPFTNVSPAGDDHGLDNNFIDFSPVMNNKKCLDIMDMVEELKRLKQKSEED